MSPQMMDGETVANLMTSPALTLRADTPIQNAVDLMEARRIRHIPVVDEADHIIGILSKRDLLARPWAFSPTEASSEMRAHTMVGELMISPVFTCTARTSIGEAARSMLQHKYDALPVVNAQGQVEGILTSADYLRHVVRNTTPQSTGEIKAYGP